MVTRIRDAGVLTEIQTLLSLGALGDLTDGDLLRRFVTRRDDASEQAFTMLVERHGPMVWRVCRSVLHQEHDVQDAFQATFLILFRRSSAIRKRDSVASWLHGVALRVASASRRASARRQTQERLAARAVESPRRFDDDDPETSQAIQEEIGRLPERYRAAIVLCYLEGLSCDAAARQLCWRIGTVKSRLARGRERLRGRLIRRGLAPSVIALCGRFIPPTLPSSLPHPLISSTVRGISSLIQERTAAEAFSAPVSILMKGGLLAMRIHTLKLVGMIALAGCVSVLGTGSLVLSARPKAAAPAANAIPSGNEDPDDEAARKAATVSLKMIGLSMHNYHSEKNHFPAAAIASADGKPLLSWRVAILPKLGYQELYDSFHLDEAWDSPHNKTLLDEMPKPYLSIGQTGSTTTYFQVFVGAGTVFDVQAGGSTLDSITDGPTVTILAVQGGKPVPWTKPEDIAYVPGEPFPKVDGPLKGGFFAAMANGSVFFLSDKISAKTLAAAVGKSDGVKLTSDDFVVK